jgi:EpsI family protein
MRPLLSWTPAALLGVGAVAIVGIDLQRELPLRMPLADAVPETLAQYRGHDVHLSEQEIAIAGMTAYLMRDYRPADSTSGDRGFSLYVGFYQRQAQGRTIHSPKNCLPGAGWEALASGEARLGPDGPVVNRYLLQNGEARALVLYWYQGRGRVASNEYAVKLDLLRDAVLHQRSDEALVRVVVPVTTDTDHAYQIAQRVATMIIPAVYRALPE